MECKFCSAQLHEGSKFCVNCGKSLVEDEKIKSSADVPMNVEPTKEEKTANVQPTSSSKKKKIRVAHFEMLAGIVIIIIGVLRLLDSGVSISSTSFGGDFYTYSYRGIVNCVNLLSQVNGTASWIIIALGIMIVFDGLKGLRIR
ncbi:MAG: zinc ribbon domain-containing protein [Clostridia bacterium]|nr:zinc ribbon domain-containing protein [Clostridia bacterium]